MKTTSRLAFASTLLISLLASAHSADRGADTGAAKAAEKADPALAHARELLKKVILIDGHNDLPWAIRNDKQAPGNVEAYDLRGKVPGQTDLARLREGGTDGRVIYTTLVAEGLGG